MKNVAVISGGFSSEVIISRKSAQTILKNLDDSKWNGHLIEITQQGWFYLKDENSYPVDKNDFSALVDGKRVLFDIVFITIHGTPGEDGKLQGYFDSIGMPYVNSGVYASALSFNKWACNQFLKNFGIQVANSMFFRKNDPINVEMIGRKLGYPCFVKPNDAGSSFGVTRVSEESALKKSIEYAFSEGNEIVIESAMIGREVTCGAYKGKEGIYPLPITEIISENDFFDFDAKYEGKSNEVTPADLTDAIASNVQRTTLLIYQILGLKGIARADYILVNDQPHLIEINTTPGMSAESLIPQQVASKGLDLKDVFTDIIEVNLA